MAQLCEEKLEELRNALRRCSPKTVQAAIHYRENGDLESLSTTIYGIIDHFQPASAVMKVAHANEETRLIEDLGLDSLALLEIALCTEEVLNTRIDTQELPGIRTIGQLNDYLHQKRSSV